VIRELLHLFLKPRVTSSAPIVSVTKQRLAIVCPLKERVLSMRAVEVGRGRFDQAIVGESHYQDVLRHVRDHDFIAVGDTPIATFLLAREPDNHHDCNAIAVLTDGGDVVGYLSREDAVRLQPTLLEHEEREEVLSCTGKLVGDEIIGVWLNLPHLSQAKSGHRPTKSTLEYDNLDVCRDVPNVGLLIQGHNPSGRSRPNWMGTRIGTIGEERYASNVERVSRGRCEKGEKITLKVLLVPDTSNPIDPAAVMVTTIGGDVLGYLSKVHAVRWGEGIKAFFESDRVVCREAGLHQRTFKSGKRTWYLAVDMTDEEWLSEAAGRV
jgi:hypothetical protein